MEIDSAEHLAEIARIETGVGTRQERRASMIEQFRDANTEAARYAYDQGHLTLALSVAPPWMAKPGEIVEGNVFGILPRQHPEYGTYPIVGLKTSSGALIAVHCLPQTLHDGMKAVAPQVGDDVAIAFMGERLSGSRGPDETPTAYHLYAVSLPGKPIEAYAW